MGDKRTRAPKDRTDAPQVASTGMIVQRFSLGRVEYVQRYTRCGKACEVCRPGGVSYDRNRPGHGPYWYKYIENGAHRIKKYCGAECPVRELDLAPKEVCHEPEGVSGGDDQQGA